MKPLPPALLKNLRALRVRSELLGGFMGWQAEREYYARTLLLGLLTIGRLS